MRADTPMGRRKPASVLSPFVVTQSDLVRREDRHARRLYRRRSFRTRDVHSASASCHACHDGPVAKPIAARRNRSNARRHRITRARRQDRDKVFRWRVRPNLGSGGRYHRRVSKMDTTSRQCFDGVSVFGFPGSRSGAVNLSRLSAFRFPRHFADEPVALPPLAAQPAGFLLSRRPPGRPIRR